eukprot:CAMPEP_0181321976 /NCGR_PEP_ID=MMETSP1101-20121128/18982_1 /TAXON_ID=46948 /ORGANISM="Rhodomonas abbreviata, Strain Caron Lab Isolate" /LENGTH=732 /DNA_ID=CAMNT_0023429859 /DNA_START=58 /DNA_END=2256 /DNA_ORIENTATION=-
MPERSVRPLRHRLAYGVGRRSVIFSPLLIAVFCGIALGAHPSALWHDFASAHARTVQAAKRITSAHDQSGLKDSVAKLIRFRNSVVSGEQSSQFSMRSKQSESPQKTELVSTRDSSDAQACMAFSEAILPVITSNYTEGCGLEKAEEISLWLAWDIFLLADPDFSFLEPKKPAGMTWNDVLHPFCQAETDLTGSTCGTDGIYARSRAIARTYVGSISEACTWHTATDVSETPLEILTGILDMYYMCLTESNNYCYPSYYEALSSFISVDSTEDPEGFMSTFIPDFCSDCTVAVFQTMATDAGNGDAEDRLMSDLICSEVLGEYCYLDLIRLESATEEEMASLWCDGLCMPLIARTWAEIDQLQGKDVRQTVTLQSTYCFSRDSNTKCLEVMDHNLTSGTVPMYEDLVKYCDAPPLGVSTPPDQIEVWEKSAKCSDISANCEGVMQNWVDSWDCCAYSYLFASETYTEDSAFFDWFDEAITECLGKPEAPKGSKACDVDGAWEVTTSFAMANLNYDYLMSDFENLADNFCEDIAQATGLNSKDCEVSDPVLLAPNGSSVTTSWKTESLEQKILITQVLQEKYEAINRRRRSGTASPDVFMFSTSRKDAFQARNDPYSLVYGNILSVSSSELPFLPGWGSNAFNHSACAETRPWPLLTASLKGGRAFTGGLGKLLERGFYEVWICFKEHPCTASFRNANHSNGTALAGGIRPPTNAADLMCFVYDEDGKRFEPW